MTFLGVQSEAFTELHRYRDGFAAEILVGFAEADAADGEAGDRGPFGDGEDHIVRGGQAADFGYGEA